MIVAVGCDHAGFVLRLAVLGYFKGRAEVLDCGVFTAEPADYPDIALKVAAAISEGRARASSCAGRA